MRILFNGLPCFTEPAAGVDPGRPIRQPGRWASAILAGLAGLIILTGVVIASGVHSYLFPIVDPDPSYSDRVIPWAGMVFFFFGCILAHELLHALVHPDGGRSDSTVLILNWRKLQFGVYYEGRFPRRRWIVMRLLPLLVLTGLALAGLFILWDRMTFTIESYLWILILTNSLGSGGDLVAALIVLRQVPPDGTMNFHRGRAYWLPGGDPVA
jgi:hypothetical protein